jgi:hypothetical protein
VVVEDFELPTSAVRLVLADDFVSEVSKWLPAWTRAEEGEEFTTSREGGVVAAKTLDQVGDCSDMVIVFDASLWTHVGEDPRARAVTAYLIAHELAHPIIDRTRHVSGAMDGVLIPSVTGTEIARSMGRIYVGEYRADRLADLVVGQFISMTVDGDTRPFRSWFASGANHAGALAGLLDDVSGRWPSTVQDYREWRIPLTEMFRTVASSVDQTLTLLVHGQAAADAAETGVDLLKLPELAPLPATRLYLAEPFEQFLDVLRGEPILPSLDQSREVEARLSDAGQAMSLEIYRRLGLTVEEHGNREWGLKVDAPLTD